MSENECKGTSNTSKKKLKIEPLIRNISIQFFKNWITTMLGKNQLEQIFYVLLRLSINYGSKKMTKSNYPKKN